jgi:hypothetical protein
MKRADRRGCEGLVLAGLRPAPQAVGGARGGCTGCAGGRNGHSPDSPACRHRQRDGGAYRGRDARGITILEIWVSGGALLTCRLTRRAPRGCYAAKANAIPAQIVAHRASDNSRTTISAGPMFSGMVAVRADRGDRDSPAVMLRTRRRARRSATSARRRRFLLAGFGGARPTFQRCIKLFSLWL